MTTTVIYLDALHRGCQNLVSARATTHRRAGDTCRLRTAGGSRSERLARVIARDNDRARRLVAAFYRARLAALTTGQRSKSAGASQVGLAARAELAGQLDEVFSLDAIVRDLAPVLDETLAGIPAES